MPLLKTLEGRGSIENPSVPISQAFDLLVDEPLRSGVRFTPEGAMKATAVLAAVRILAETIAHLPLNLFRRLDPRGKDLARDHPLFPVLHDRANPEMTAFTFRETQMVSLLIWKNAYAQIEADSRGRIAALWPLPGGTTRLVREGNRRVRYESVIDGRLRKFMPGEVFHISTLSLDGWEGWFSTQLIREAIGLALATEEFGARWFGQGSRSSVVLKHPNQLTDEAHQRLRREWREMHVGLANMHKPAILEEGMDLKEISVPPEQSQFLESRKFQVNEIARAFRIPPHMLGDLERATFSNIEQQNLEFHQDTMLPWLKRWEQEINRQLLLERERPVLFAEFNADAILRGDLESRFKAYFTARQGGWMSTNDVREKENANPIPGGDDYLRPLNLVEVGTTVEEPNGNGGSAGRATRSVVLRRSVAIRRRLILAFIPLLGSTLGRLSRIEVREVKKAVDRFLRRGDVTAFLEWLATFYFDEFPELLTEQMLGPFQSLAETIVAAAVEEVGGEPLDQERLDAFVREYTTGFARRHAAESRRRLAGLATDPPGEVDPAAAILDAIAEWDTARSKIDGQDEGYQMGNAIARVAFMAAGVLHLIWFTFGDNCPYCDSLSGRRVGVDVPFLGQGEALNPADADGPLIASSDVRHPPAHSGCDCMVGPGI